MPASDESDAPEPNGRPDAGARPTGGRFRRRRVRGDGVEDQGDALFARTLGEHGVRGIARRTDSYGFVLLTLAVLIWIFVPLATDRSWARLVTVAIFYLAIVVSLHTSRVHPTTLRTAAVVGALVLGVSLTGVVIDSAEWRAVGDLGFALVLVFAALVILRRIMQHDFVTSRTISGAVSVYLLLGLAFANAANGIELLDAGSFAANSGPANYGTLQYWSFVTIATLGYGDVVPVTAAARSLATLEAVIGQVYLVTIVARLVGLFGREVIRPTFDRAEPPEG